MKDTETEGRKGEKKEKGIARHGGMFMTAVVWLQGSLSDAKAVSGNTFICPHFLLPSLWIPHPSVAIFLQKKIFDVSQEISITEKSAVRQFTWHA